MPALTSPTRPATSQPTSLTRTRQAASPAPAPTHPPAQPPASLSFAALVAAYCDDEHVVTGDDGLDHYV